MSQKNDSDAKKALNDKMREILDFLIAHVEKEGYPASVREICAHFDMKSTATAHYYLTKLEEANIIKRSSRKNRAIEISGEFLPSKSSVDFVNIPIIGKIAAGVPITAVEMSDDWVSLPKNLFGNDGLFILTVRGDSMIEAGILNGDKVIIRQQDTANNGEIIAALTDENEATLKRYFNEGDRIRLKPENSAMEDMYFANVQILGVAIGLIRENM